MITEKEINAAYATLATRKRAFQEATEAEASATRTLKVARATAMLSGKIVGKNDHERDACAEAVLAAEFTDRDEQERWRREAQYDYDMASLEVDRIKLVIRLLELSIGTEKAV